jgi:ribose transport system permease protein
MSEVPTIVNEPDPASRSSEPATPPMLSRASRLQAEPFLRFGLVYVGIALAILFSVWVPSTFLSRPTLLTLLNSNATTALLALSIVIPLACGVFDLSIGYTMGLGATVSGSLAANANMSTIEVLLITIIVGAIVGVVNGFVVEVMGIDSFIGTLGTGSVVEALTIAFAGNQTIVNNIPQVISPLSNDAVGGVQVPVFVVFAMALIIWYVMSQTALGRYSYAVGFNLRTARLAGIATRRLRFSAFLWSGILASVSGLFVTGRLGSVDATVGPQYLLPAFAAVFLGTTLHRLKRFNSWGTLVAIAVLALATEGLSLTGAPIWVPDLFNGGALILALGITRLGEKNA